MIKLTKTKIMEKKYLKPEIDVVDMVAEEAMMVGSAIDAGLSDDTQNNEDALERELGLTFPFEF